MTDSSTLILKDVKVLFANFEDKGYGRSITIDATDKAVQDAITKWVETNKIGLIVKGRNANEATYDGKPKFTDYNGTIQYSFKLAKEDNPAFKSEVEGKSLKDVRYTAHINLVARAFNYDNNFGSGVSQVIDAISLVKAPEGIDKDKELELI